MKVHMLVKKDKYHTKFYSQVLSYFLWNLYSVCVSSGLCCCSNIQETMQKKAETALDCLKFCSKNPLNLKAFGHKKKAVCENASHYRYMLNYPIRSIL